MPEVSARLELPFIVPSQAQKHVTHNEALLRLDSLVQLTLAGADEVTPPTTVEEGQAYAIGASPSGDWAGQSGQIAFWQNNAWHFVTPQEGWRAWDQATAQLLVFGPSGWNPATGDFQNMAGLGINTSFDSTNKLSVASDATLLTHDGAGHQLKINKASASDTAALLYQTGFSGRAELGLAGDDNFHLKVSADGSAWTEALLLNATSGLASGAAVQSDAIDAGSGKLMTTGAFGLGGAAPDWPVGDLDDGHLVGTGWYYSGSAANRPAGAGFIAHTRRSANGQHQMFVSVSTPGANFMRTKSGAGWTDWVALVPEHGANANGHYTRFADGTQICHHVSPALQTNSFAVGSTGFHASNAFVWNFPASFVSSPVTTATALRETGAHSHWAMIASGHSTSSARRGFLLVAGDPIHTGFLHVTAIGRWY